MDEFEYLLSIHILILPYCQPTDSTPMFYDNLNTETPQAMREPLVPQNRVYVYRGHLKVIHI